MCNVINSTALHLKQVRKSGNTLHLYGCQMTGTHLICCRMCSTQIEPFTSFHFRAGFPSAMLLQRRDKWLGQVNGNATVEFKKKRNHHFISYMLRFVVVQFSRKQVGTAFAPYRRCSYSQTFLSTYSLSASASSSFCVAIDASSIERIGSVVSTLQYHRHRAYA